MKLSVNVDQRFAKMRAHTATHLLHAELAKIFPNTKQAGSLVDSDFLRFDFVADRLLDQYEVDKINKVINQIIFFAYTVKMDETSYQEAIKLWAKAFFEEKYGDEVRVIQIVWNIETQDSTESVKSIELCGGTHVENTKDIGCFMIVSQEAVASGVKRITAYTGPKVYERVQELQSILDITVNKLWIKTATQLEDKLDKVMKEYDEMNTKYQLIEDKMIEQWLKETFKKGLEHFDKELADYPVPFSIVPELEDFEFKNIINKAQKIRPKQQEIGIIYTKTWNFAIFCFKKWHSAKKWMSDFWLKWWGNDQMVQGRDEKVLWLFE